jgi:hypothetical protein
MIYVWLIAGLLLVAGTAAFALVKVRKEFHAAIFSMRERERSLSQRIEKVESALSEKAGAAESRHVATMIEGVASVCRRMEARLRDLGDRGPDSGFEADGD